MNLQDKFTPFINTLKIFALLYYLHHKGACFSKEIAFRKKVGRVIIVSPGSLAEQWQDELSQKFHLDFSLLYDDEVLDLCIARLDTLARNKSLLQRISGIHGDLADTYGDDEPLSCTGN